MTEYNLITTNRKYIDYAQSNYRFLNRISKSRKESQYIDIAQVKKKIISITAKLKTLSKPEISQWSQIHFTKVRELANIVKLKSQNTNDYSKQSTSQQFSTSIRQQFHIIVESCRSLNIQYNSEELAHIIQQFYYREYKQDVLEIMEQAGYKTNQFRMLYYQQPSFFNICGCLDSIFK